MAVAAYPRSRYNPNMDSVTLENYRCFRERQTARLAPLTLLVGENGAGKTAFLTRVRDLRNANAAGHSTKLRSGLHDDRALYRPYPKDRKRVLKRVEAFGQESGLFDEIQIESAGAVDGDSPFQVKVSKFGKRVKVPRQNSADGDCGVSRALSLIAKLLRPDAPSLFLLQQPETHLHPRAQAALGSLFCSVAGPERQIVVETHSDYIIDRARMEVRDKTTGLKPDDVSILYFERGAGGARIHNIRIDKHGNVLDTPDSYERFFMEETTRSIGI